VPCPAAAGWTGPALQRPAGGPAARSPVSRCGLRYPRSSLSLARSSAGMSRSADGGRAMMSCAFRAASPPARVSH